MVREDEEVKKEVRMGANIKVSVPGHIADLLTPMNIYMSLHAIDFANGGYTCPTCAREWSLSDYPKNVCTCGRFLDERCTTSGCENMCRVNGDKDYWWRPDPVCAQCARDSRRSERAQLLKYVPRALYSAAVSSYWRQDHRYKLDHRLAEWIRTRCGYDQPGMRVLYIYGSVGAGKTVSAIRAANRAVMDGLVDSFFYIREADLITAAKSMYGDDSSKSQKILRRARDAGLLFVDEMFARPEAYTEHVTHVLGDMFATRFERKSPGLFTSNEPPIWGVVFDQRISSRFDLVAHVEQVIAPDMRKTHAKEIHSEHTGVEK